MTTQPGTGGKSRGPYSWLDVVVIVLLVVLKEAFSAAGIPIFVPIATYVAARGIWYYSKQKGIDLPRSTDLPPTGESLPSNEAPQPLTTQSALTQNPDNQNQGTPAKLKKEEQGPTAANQDQTTDKQKSLINYYFFGIASTIILTIAIFSNRYDYRLPMKIEGAMSLRQDRIFRTIEAYFEQIGWIDISLIEKKHI